MIDFIKINITDALRFEEHIVKNQILELKTFLNFHTGTVELYPKYGKYENFDIKINPKFSKISGSLHKFENLSFLLENQNFNDFTFDDMKNQIPLLEESFDLKDNNSLSYLELGFNIQVDIDPQKILDNNLLMYNFKNHQKDLKFNGKGDYKEFIKGDYSIKIYNKSKQYKLNSHILRVELKLKTKRKIQYFGIFNLNDLLDKNKIYKIFEFLYNEFDKLVIIDDFKFENLPFKDKDKLTRYTNPYYWQNLRIENKSFKVLSRLKKDFNLTLERHNLNSLKEDLKYKLRSKFLNLIEKNKKIVHTSFLNKG